DRAGGGAAPGVSAGIPRGSDPPSRTDRLDGAVTDPHIAFEGVQHAADGTRILHDVSLRLSAHRTAVIGANGSGKSTFARMLNALRLPTAGAARVLGLDPASDAAKLRSRVGFVFTNPEAQILMPTPAEDLTL